MGHGASLHGEEAVELTADDKALLAVELKVISISVLTKLNIDQPPFRIIRQSFATIQ